MFFLYEKPAKSFSTEAEDCDFSQSFLTSRLNEIKEVLISDFELFGVWNFMTFGFLSCNLFFVLTKPISYVDYFVNRLIFLLFSLFSTDEFLLTRCSMSTICSSSFDCMTSELLLLPISYSISFLFSLTCCSYSPHSSSILMPMSNIS